VLQTRRQWIQTAALGLTCGALRAARKEFWETKDPSSWTNDEKQALLGDSPWARQGLVRMETPKKKPTPSTYGNSGTIAGMPDTRPGVPPGGAKSVPIGEKIPPPPKPDTGPPVQFQVLARWETAKPVRLAGGPDVPEMAGQFYVIRLRGLPLMPPPKTKPGEQAENPNATLLQALKEGSRLERKDKQPIPCAHLFTGSGDAVNEVLLFFPRPERPITVSDETVTLDSEFGVFHLSIRFPLKQMQYRGELTL
jgi:hypothetical protein